MESSEQREETGPKTGQSQGESVNQKTRGWLKLGLAVVVLGLAALVCLGGLAYFAIDTIWQEFEPSLFTATTSEEAVSGETPLYNSIAFIGNDDNLWLVSPDGQNQRYLTEDGSNYRMPAWSPDGRYLAFIGTTLKNKAILYVTPAGRSEPVSLFDNPGSSPFYLYWAPDSQAVTFLTQEPNSMAMRQVEVNLPDANRVLGEGAPFYWVWSPAADKLLMHVYGSRALSPQAHLSILPNRSDAERIELKLAPGGFQAPAWSPDGEYIFYVASANSAEAIYRMDHETLEESLVTAVSGFAFMVISPTGQQVAYLQIERDNRPPFGTAYVVDSEGGNKRRLTDEPVASMYWSPDGRKLALLTPARRSDGATARVDGLASPLPQELQLRWWIYEVETGELQPLFSFSPTLDFLQTVPYFDQYHLSLTFWSPDSRYMVVAKENPKNHDGTLWVVDTTGQEEPRQVGEGTIAVWSWR